MADTGPSTSTLTPEDTGFSPATVSTAFFSLGGARAKNEEAKWAPGQFLTVCRNFVSPVMLAFDATLIAVNAYLHAENELDTADCWDPACQNWRDDADAALARVEARTVAMRTLSPVLPGDKPLIRMSTLLCIMLRTTTPSDLARAHGVLTAHAMMFECADSDPVAERVNGLLRRGRSLLDSLAALPLHVDADGDSEFECLADADLPDHHELDYLGEAA